MVHPDMFRKAVSTKVNDDANSDEVNDDAKTIVVEIDVVQQFSNDQVFNARQHMFDWVRMEASKLGFDVVIERSDNSTSRRQAFATIICERGGKYVSKNITSRGLRSEMQQLFKLLDDNHYVSRYRVCDDKVSVRDIFRTHTESVNLFNTFPTVLIIDSTYKINKYRLPLLEIFGFTSTKMTFSVGFAFLECEKEENVTWALDICKSLLKNPQNMPSVIVIDRDKVLVNAVGIIVPISRALLCRYHITKNVRAKLKPAVDTQDFKGEDGNMLKYSVVVETIMDA
ncbi:protein FAR1-RELATED SEQUENCE 5-like [Vicia villosa]|uniref:protein FAR1-RELATED SEQUENCE 5-like n=1 Tax=Vicia villosa TaxID=3911 RepID=UPI00273ADEF1|nr:protein FAR1-RELATED SEQUENCE 5-like [Vicia villosa]